MSTSASLTDAYLHSYPQLRKAARRFVGVEDADDMVQEAFVRALRRSSSFRGEAAHTTWLYRIVVNACIDARRQAQRRGMHVTLDEAHAAARQGRSPRLIDRRALRTALASLEATDRDVCVLYDVMGCTHREIADRLGLAVGTSKRRLFTARRRLRRLLTT